MLKALRDKKAEKNQYKAQSTFEFSFTLIATVLLILGTIRVFIWSGRDLWRRRQAHNAVLLMDLPNSGSPKDIASFDPLLQTRPTFFFSTEINGITVNSALFGQQ